MDIEMARGWYGGDWYRTPDGGVHPGNDPANPAEIARVVDPFRAQLQREITPGLRTLDLGCNAGRHAFAMEQMGAVATGLDCVDWAVEYANKLATKWGSRCRFVEGDFDRLPFGPASFDLALFAQNIVETPYAQMERLIDQLATIVAPAGRLCILMQDQLLKALNKGKVGGYEAATGMIRGFVTSGRGDRRPYDVCFWTLGFARHVIERQFALERCEQIKDEMYWLVFVNR